MCGNVRTNPLFPKLLPYLPDFPPSHMNVEICRHEGKPPSLLLTLVSHAVAVFLLHKEQVLTKRESVFVVYWLFPIIMLLGLFLSPDRTVFSQELAQILIQLPTENALALTG